MIAFPVSKLLQDKNFALHLTLLKGKKGLGKKITIPQIQKPGLALTGDTANLHSGRVQVFGNSEIKFLKGLETHSLKRIIEKIMRVNLACIILTSKQPPLKSLANEAEKRGVPLLQTSLPTATFIIRVTKFLEDQLAEKTMVHGVLVDVFGIGILLLGKSGMGKSECGMELVMKGHRLVADDIVSIRKKGPHTLQGSGSELAKYHMEIRGLGIINIKDLFGVASVRDEKWVELVIELIEWKPREDYERLGIDDQTYEILGVRVPFLRIPVRPGRSLTSIIEVAARNQLLKIKGIHSAREFQDKLTRQLLLEASQRGG